MNSKKSARFSRFNRFRLMITLSVAILLPAIGLIYLNYSQLRALQRDKLIEAAIHRDFQDSLAFTEKTLNKKAYALAEETRTQFPSPDLSQTEKEKQFDLLLAKQPWLTHVMLFDEKGFVVRTQPAELNDKFIREEHDRLANDYAPWFKMEGKDLAQDLHKRPRSMTFYPNERKRGNGEFVTSAMFVLPQVEKDRPVLGYAVFDSCYLRNNLFPEVMDQVLSEKLNDETGNRLAMMFYPANVEGWREIKPFVTSAGWGDGRPEVARNFDDVFRGLAVGIKYQGTSIEALGQMFIRRSIITLGIFSLMFIAGLAYTKHVVSKEMALAKLKSDFVSNVSHELRTPLALIRLYAETLELGRIQTSDKMHQYYKIIRKESERLTALINNILDFSRIEAGRKEYEFRDTDIGELVRNTLDSYRYQIEQQGFALEESIEPDLPAVKIDREAIARALVNLVNNALKYSTEDKFVGIKLYRENSQLKLEVVDHGIGIARRDQSKIFEKFYRAGDPLVHNTKGSGLGLSLVRHISHAHGGDIVVESTPGRGSRFILSLPVLSGHPNKEMVAVQSATA